jgi:DNA-binding CsgD family transcriptional regulator
MLKLDPPDLMAVILVGKELLSSKTFREFCDNVSNYLLDAFEAQGCIITLLKEGRIDPRSSIFAGSCASDKDKLYSDYYYKLDPLLRAPYTPYPYKIYTTGDIVGDEDAFEKSEYYNQFLKPLSIRSHLFMNLGCSGRFAGTLIATRNSKSRRFSSTDKSLAVLLEPYLSAALEKTLLLDQNLRQEFIISSLLEKVPAKGIVVLDRSYSPIHKNRNSEVILSMFYQPDEPRDGLPAQMVRELEDRINGIVEMYPRDAPPPEITAFEMIPPGTRRKVRVSVRPTAGTGRPYFLVFLELEHNTLFLSRQLLRYGLTEREVEIASCVCEGLKNNEIAKRLIISDYTVANHIKHIFEKLNISSRASLLQLVLELTQ